MTARNYQNIKDKQLGVPKNYRGTSGHGRYPTPGLLERQNKRIDAQIVFRNLSTLV